MKRTHLIAGPVLVLFFVVFGANVTRAADVTVQDVIEKYKLKVTLKNGHVILDFIDPETGLETLQRVVGGTDAGLEVLNSDWTAVNGVKFANKMVIKTAAQEITYVVTKSEANPKIDDARIKKPDGVKGDTSKPADAKKDK